MLIRQKLITDGKDCNGHLLQELCMEMDLSVLNFGPSTEGTWTVNEMIYTQG